MDPIFNQKNISFDEFKKQTLNKLSTFLKHGEVDEKALVILDAINAHDCYVTTSSCAGRIILIQLPMVGDKKQAVFLGRWHDPVSIQNVMDAISNYEEGQLWFITQSPIFHITCRSIEDADRLIKIGIASGFKHSGFKSSTPKVNVELLSTERMDVPLAKQDYQFLLEEYLVFLTKTGNDLIRRGQEKLTRLQKNLEKMKQK